MNSKERFLTAMTGGQPDRVPCTPDFSNMIPCRLTGKPFWDIYLKNDPPLWKAYLDAVEYFGIDAWFFNGALDYRYPENTWVPHETGLEEQGDDMLVQKERIDTPEGELFSQTTYYRADPPTPSEKPLKDVLNDFAKFRHFFMAPTQYSTETARQQLAAIDGRHAFGTTVGFPGFQWWSCFTEGGVAPLAFAEVDCPEVLEEMRELNEKQVLTKIDMILDSGLFDFVLLGGSGSITLASPDLFDKYAFPTIQKVTRMCKEAGVATMLHSCGKEEYIVKRCAEDSDLDCINPLEIPPMGDCDLAEVKQKYGDRLSLMGNLHTTEVMLKGTVDEVEAAAKKCIDDAGEGGGFILSTGDQCGRDTPDENIFKLVEVCEQYGRY